MWSSRGGGRGRVDRAGVGGGRNSPSRRGIDGESLGAGGGGGGS